MNTPIKEESMEQLVKGIHHFSMKCTAQQLEGVMEFYHGLLGFPIVRRWEGGLMLDTGSGLLEVFSTGEGSHEKGAIRHIALACADTDRCAAILEEAGYRVFIGPKDIEIPSGPPLFARIAFCTGPIGEEIEFFQEK